MQKIEKKVRFDGNTVFDEETNTRYPINGNYASKSKLIPGDYLMMRIDENGIEFKIVEFAPKKTAIAEIEVVNKKISALYDGFVFELTPCLLNFYKLKEGDKVIIIYNPFLRTFCAIEGKIEE